jgi:uroporphyrinogen decarboxylase
MTMSSRERVRAAFDHVEPDRVPAWCGALPEFWEKAKRELVLDDEGLRTRFGDDFRRVWSRYAGPSLPLPPGISCRTIFGIERRGLGCGQPTSHPLEGAELREIHDHPWPDPAWMDVSGIRAEAEAWGKRYAILGGEWSPFWHDAIDLLGMEGILVRMVEDPEAVDAVIDRIVDFYFEVSRRTFEAAGDAIDVFFIGNDFGTQTGPIVGEKMFRRFLLPPLRRLIDLGHAYRLKVMLHCCGGYAPLIPALIEAGLDGLHAVQPCCRGMDLRTLKASFGDRILFNGAIDSQRILIDGTPGFVREKTWEVLRIMKPGGGYVAGASHDAILPETPVENVLAMFDAIRDYGEY